MEASQQVEEIKQVGMFVETDLDLRRFVIESQKRYFKKRGIEPGSDRAKDHLDLARSLLGCIMFHYDRSSDTGCVFNEHSFTGFFLPIGVQS